MQPRYAASFQRTRPGGQAARRFIKRIAGEWLSGNRLTDLELAVGEAVSNAVQYGEGISLHVACWTERGNLVTEIGSRGDGFGRIGPPELPPIGSVRGYGLFIIHHVVDAVEFFDGGTRMRLTKRLPTGVREPHEDHRLVG